MNDFKTDLFVKNGVAQVIIVLSATLIIPFVVHQIPSVNSVPIGAMLLPMFYISIPSLYFFKNYKLVSVAVGLAPVTNFLITGHPDLGLVYILTMELILYTIILYWLLQLNKKSVSVIAGGLGYILTKVVSTSTLFLPFKLLDLDAKQFFFGSISNALPGIFILCIISYFTYSKFNSNG